MRTSDFVTLVGRTAAETEYPACPDAHVLTMTGNGMFDEAGHQVEMVHTAHLRHLATAVAVVREIHRPFFEDFVPRCGHDGRVWPCPTELAVRT